MILLECFCIIKLLNELRKDGSPNEFIQQQHECKIYHMTLKLHFSAIFAPKRQYSTIGKRGVVKGRSRITLRYMSIF